MVLFSIVALLSNLSLPLIVSFPKKNASAGAVQHSGVTTTSPTESCLKIKWLTIPRAWMASHLLTFAILFSTSLTRSPSHSTILVSVLGISWAVTQWAPLALTSVFIETQQPHRPVSSQRSFDNYSIDPPATISDDDIERGEDEALVVAGGLRAGAVMGIFNLAIAAPQIVAALGSSIIFGVLRWWELDETEAVGFVIRIWGLASLGAAWLAAGI